MSSGYNLITSTRYDHFLLSRSWNNDSSGPCPFLLLQYHFERLISATIEHGWQDAKSALSSYNDFKHACLDAVESFSQSRASTSTREGVQQAYMVRISLSEAGSLGFHLIPLKSLQADPTAACYWRPLQDNPNLYGIPLPVVLDPEASETSIFTRTKTSNRAVYETSRVRTSLPNVDWEDPASSHLPKDVLLHTTEGTVTESSRCNICVYRAPHWVTPSLSSGCLPGVMRRWMLEQGRIREAPEDEPIRTDSIKEGDFLLLLNGVRGCLPARITAASTAD